MSKAPSMPFFVDAYMADTMHLSECEDGIYMRLLMCMWRMEGRLPDDDVRLARFVRIPKQKWCKKYRPILSEFFDIENGYWTQKRLAKEWQYVAEKINKNRINGNKGGRPKSAPTSKIEIPVKPTGFPKRIPVSLPDESQREPTQTQSHTQTQTQTQTQTHKNIPIQSSTVDDDGQQVSNWIWDQGFSYLQTSGLNETEARRSITVWLNNHDGCAVKNAILRAQVTAKNNPQAYISKILINGQYDMPASLWASHSETDKAAISAAIDRVFGDPPISDKGPLS